MNDKQKKPAMQIVRCAIYTRKSTEDGLEQEFNSLDAQRESAEAYIKSQSHEGWVCLPDRYDDGGFTGGNMDRPALKRLLVDIEAGQVDTIVVYKIDRLSRSLLDFARMMETFEKHRVSFISVTQSFNTATSMGRLVLNVLLSFAQFEREIISERTRDKIAATRRKGKWAGGHPILGYDVDPCGFKLIVNEAEAKLVRAIFEMYLKHGSLLPVVEELAQLGWVNKRWTSRKGKELGGQPFDRTNLYRLLTNVVYVGKIRYKDEIHNGEHAAIVDAEVFQRVQELLRHNGRERGAPYRNQMGALLKGILRCAPCGCAMTPSHSTKHGHKRYRYYVCSRAQKRGRKTCPSKALPAHEIERFVVEQLRSIGRDPALLQATVAQMRAQDDGRVTELEAERRVLEKDVIRWNTEVRQLTRDARRCDDDPAIACLADLHERIRLGENRIAKIREETTVLRRRRIDDDEVAQALSAFTPVWEALTPHEQARVVQLLVERVEYDGVAGKVSITFQPAGVKTLAQEVRERRQENGRRLMTHAG